MPLETANFIEGLDSSWPKAGDPAEQGDDHLRLIKHILVTQFPGSGSNGFAEAITATEQELNWLGGLTSNVQAQLDSLDARVTDLEGVLIATPGTVMPFYQASAPLGWTKVVTHNDHMMRIVSGVGGVSGGSDSPILNDTIPTHSHSASSTVVSTAHTHTFSDTSTTNSVDHTHDVSGTTAGSGGHTHNAGLGGAGVVDVCPSPSLMGSSSGINCWDGLISSVGDHTHTYSGTSAGVSATHTHDISGTTSAMSANGSHSHVITVVDNTGSDWTPKYMDFIIASKD